MALPVILVDSATGSDTQASGAGPSTALFGTTDASTDGAGTTVTLTAGTDLSGVATDGSHVIYLADSTAGARNFGKITGTSGSGGATPTVTVANAFGLSLSGKSWAIGGKRASVWGTNSKKLFNNNSGNGDAMPGWIVEMQSGHTETSSASMDLYRAGDATSGRIILRGASGAATRPVITYSGVSWAMIMRANYQMLQDFDVACSAAAVHGVRHYSAGICSSKGIKIYKSGSGSIGIGFLVDSNLNLVEDCRLQDCATGISVSSRYNSIFRNYVVGASTVGIVNSDTIGNSICHNICVSCAKGIEHSGTANIALGNVDIFFNTIDQSTGDGLKVSGAAGTGGMGLRIQNNQITNSGGYNLHFSDTGWTQISATALLFLVSNNNTYLGTSGNVKLGGEGATTDSIFSGDPHVQPYVNSVNASRKSAEDWSVESSVVALGYPTLNIGFTSTRSYTDIGVQRKNFQTGNSVKALAGGGLKPAPFRP